MSSNYLYTFKPDLPKEQIEPCELNFTFTAFTITNDIIVNEKAEELLKQFKKLQGRP